MGGLDLVHRVLAHVVDMRPGEGGGEGGGGGGREMGCRAEIPTRETYRHTREWLSAFRNVIISQGLLTHAVKQSHTYKRDMYWGKCFSCVNHFVIYVGHTVHTGVHASSASCHFLRPHVVENVDDLFLFQQEQRRRAERAHRNHADVTDRLTD